MYIYIYIYIYREANSKDIKKLGKKDGVKWSEFFASVSNEIKQITISNPNVKAKVLFLCRHAEGAHNAAEKLLGSERWETIEALSEEYFDASINEAGENQSNILKNAVDKAIKDGLKIDLIIVSPLTRAIQTAKIGFGSFWNHLLPNSDDELNAKINENNKNNNKIPILSYEIARERFGKNTCDRRKSREMLEKEFPEIKFFLDDEHDPHWTEIRETPDQVKIRASIFLNMIMEMDDYESILLCGHSDYISNLLELVGHPFHW